MAESAKSLTSLVLLVVTTALFAAGWESDAHAQKQMTARLTRSGATAGEGAPTRESVAPPQSAVRHRSVTVAVDPSPLARLSPGKYRIVDAAGRVAWLSVESGYSSGLPPRSRVTLMNVDGQSMALIRDEAALSVGATAGLVR